jgi:hypothetical protein
MRIIPAGDEDTGADPRMMCVSSEKELRERGSVLKKKRPSVKMVKKIL